MNRKEFIKICGILGLSVPFQGSVSSCENNNTTASDFNGKVIVVGAGAGGLSSGYLLKQQGIDFQILEASSSFGGRMKINTDFADFPIPLGAEWLETDTDIFQEIVNDSSISVNVETITDTPDRKFVNSSWFNFFEEYIVPSIFDKISFNTVVKSIDYSGDRILITTQNGQYIADKVIVSVPLKILQDGDIDFTPSLPEQKLNAINSTTIWEGFKAFIEFSEKFYGDGFEFSINPESNGQKEYYNASHGQDTSKHILGLFVVGKPALDYSSLSGDDLRDYMLEELDDLFSNQATPNYIKHITQDWNNEPFIKSGYLSDHAQWQTVRELGKSIDEKVYFAGGAYTDGANWVSVHTAAQSAKNAIEEILN